LTGFYEKLKPFDIAAIIYIIAVSSLIIIFGGLDRGAIYNLLSLAAYLFLIILIVNIAAKSQYGWRAFIRRSYPLFSFTFLYEQTGQYIHLIFPGFFDYLILSFEKSVFGVNPTIFLQTLSYPPLNEVIYFGYFSYYFLILILMLYLYSKNSFHAFEKLVTATSITFYISYLTFILFPVQGPRWTLAADYYMAPEGYIFVPLTNFIIKSAGLLGGCMPSSHVAIGVVTTLICKRYAPILFRPYLLLTTGLTVGTVWGRFHYVSDAAAGILLGLFTFYLSEKLVKPF